MSLIIKPLKAVEVKKYVKNEVSTKEIIVETPPVLTKGIILFSIIEAHQELNEKINLVDNWYREKVNKEEIKKLKENNIINCIFNQYTIRIYM